MLVTNRGSKRFDEVGIALTAPHLILLGRASAVPLRSANVVTDLTEYAGGGWAGGFGGASRQPLTLSVAEDDGNNRSEIGFTTPIFTGVNGPEPSAPVAALIEEITSDALSNIIAFVPILVTAAAIVPTAASNASPAQIDFGSAHGLTTNDLVYVVGFAGGTWADNVNGRVFKITVVDADSISLQGLDSTGFGAATFASAVIYRPLAHNGADFSLTPNAEGVVQSIPRAYAA